MCYVKAIDLAKLSRVFTITLRDAGLFKANMETKIYSKLAKLGCLLKKVFFRISNILYALYDENVRGDVPSFVTKQPRYVVIPVYMLGK